MPPVQDAATAAPRGALFLVLGPSGAGKDTLIDGARAVLARDSRYIFPRRVITRPAEACGEQHEAMTQEAFAAARRAGAFALAWSAYGHDYGIPARSPTPLPPGGMSSTSCARCSTRRADVSRRPWSSR